jgi:hypothetical protein
MGSVSGTALAVLPLVERRPLVCAARPRRQSRKAGASHNGGCLVSRRDKVSAGRSRDGAVVGSPSLTEPRATLDGARRTSPGQPGGPRSASRLSRLQANGAAARPAATVKQRGSRASEAMCADESATAARSPIEFERAVRSARRALRVDPRGWPRQVGRDRRPSGAARTRWPARACPARRRWPLPPPAGGGHRRGRGRS